MKKATQPLKLNRETVRQLSLGTLVGIQPAAPAASIRGARQFVSSARSSVSLKAPNPSAAALVSWCRRRRRATMAPPP